MSKMQNQHFNLLNISKKKGFSRIKDDPRFYATAEICDKIKPN